MNETESRPSWGSRIIAVLVLAVGAWVLFKLVIGTVVAIAWIAAVIAAIIAIFWAIRTLT
jgi:energy-converting hydrogenase Eha subunit A